MKQCKGRSGILMSMIILVVISLTACMSWTPQIRDDQNRRLTGSIAVLESVPVGGIEQYILIRGNNINNPILLFLHGGPGYPQISFSRKFQAELEKDFIVVQWDQRGSGKSYSQRIPESSMNREQFVSDTIELVHYLLKRFNQEKLYLAGHSWGSDLGIRTAVTIPDKLYAYIGIGQVVHTDRQEQISYAYVMDKAVRDQNKKAVRELEEIGYPPYGNHETDVMVQRAWLEQYGGVEIGVKSLREIIKATLFSPEYSWADGIRFIRGNYLTRRTMFNAVKDVDLIADYPVLNIPAVFIAGRYDYNTPSSLVYEYYQFLEAPAKKFYWFEYSAHFPHFEEPEKFAHILGQLRMDIKHDTCAGLSE